MDHTILIASLQAGNRLDFNPGTGAFSAVTEKRAGCNRRANGESARQLAALNQAVNELSVTLNDKTALNTDELITLHKDLSKKINYIKSHTTGLMGWLCSLFRSKKETRDLKAVGSKLRDVRYLVSRTQGAASILIANNIRGNQSNNQILQMIRAEFPQLIHQGPITQGPITASSFGMSEQHPAPKIPFLITKSPPLIRTNPNSTSYRIYFPPSDINKEPTFSLVFNLNNIPMEHQSYINSFGREIRQKIDNYLYNDLNQRPTYNHKPLEEAHIIETEFVTCDDTVNPRAKIILKYINPETNKEEKVSVTVNRHTTYEEVKNKVDEIIEQNKQRAEKAEEFLKKTFKGDSDGNGIHLNRNWGFHFKPKEIRPDGDWYQGLNGNFSISSIQVQGLGEQAYEEIKAIKEGFERNAAVLKPLVRPFLDVYAIAIKNTVIKVEFDSANRQITLKNYHNQTIYAKVSYTGDLQKALDDLAASLPIRDNCQLSSQVLSQVNPMSGDDHVIKLPRVSLNKLKQFKKKINFSGHDLTTADDGNRTTKQRIFSGIDRMVNMVAQYRAGRSINYYGIPAGAEERKKYFDELEARLTHVIAALEKPENKEMLSEVMINLGVGGNHCGGRWKDEVTKYYSMLCRPKIDETNIPLDSWLQIKVDQQKQEIVEKMVTEANSQNTGHVRMRYLKHLKEQGIAVPGWEAAMYQDPYSNLGGGVFGSEILNRFNNQFDFSKFLVEWKEEISKRLKNYEGAGAAICQNFGGQVTNRLRTAVRTHLLADMPEKQAEFAQLDRLEKKAGESDKEYQERIVSRKNEFLDQIIEDLKLITIDEEVTFSMNGITMRGMLLLALQTGILEFKENQKPLDFIQTLNA